MTTAVLNGPRDASTMTTEEIMNWKAPKAEVGMTVLYYNQGDLDSKPIVATVLKAGSRTVNLVTVVGRMGCDSVMHKNDPRAKPNSDLAKNGLWDFTDDYKQTVVLREQVISLTSKVDALNARIDDFLGEDLKKKK